MTRLLLIGHQGQLGRELYNLLPELGTVVGADYPEVDFTVPDTICRLVRTQRPTLIINAAGHTAVDQAESEPELARKLNAEAVGVLAEEARRVGAGLVHYSTDYVFDGEQRRPYTEEDQPRPLNVYGQTKLEGDRAIAAVGVPHLILRLAWLYGWHGRNFLLTIRRRAAEGRRLRVVDDQVGCPTWSRVAAETTVAILRQVLPPTPRVGLREVSGVYHAVCAGATSWYGLARACLPPTVPVQPISSAEYGARARRPAYSVLDCRKLRETFGLTMPAWQEALRQCLAEEPRR